MEISKSEASRFEVLKEAVRLRTEHREGHWAAGKAGLIAYGDSEHAAVERLKQMFSASVDVELRLQRESHDRDTA